MLLCVSSTFPESRQECRSHAVCQCWLVSDSGRWERGCQWVWSIGVSKSSESGPLSPTSQQFTSLTSGSSCLALTCLDDGVQHLLNTILKNRNVVIFYIIKCSCPGSLKIQVLSSLDDVVWSFPQVRWFEFEAALPHICLQSLVSGPAAPQLLQQWTSQKGQASSVLLGVYVLSHHRGCLGEWWLSQRLYQEQPDHGHSPAPSQALCGPVGEWTVQSLELFLFWFCNLEWNMGLRGLRGDITCRI